MQYEVIVAQVEPRLMAAVRRLARQDQLPQVVPAACGEVWKFILEFGISHLGINVSIYLDCLINLECGVLVNERFNPAGNVFCSATLGGLVASTIHLGPYHQLDQAHQAIHKWCQDHDLDFAGPSWEIYDHWNEDESKLRTDVFYQLKCKA